MPYLSTDDGVRLYYEEAGSGAPVIFVHWFAGDQRSWEPQVRYFSRRYRCIAFNARGWRPPMSRRTWPAIRRRALSTTSVRSSMVCKSTRRTSSVCRWAASPPCTSASPTPPVRARCWLPGGLRLGAPASARNSAPRRSSSPPGWRRRTWPRSPRPMPRHDRHTIGEQGPARLCRVQGDAGGAFRQGSGQHPARRAARAPVGPRSGG